MELREIIESFRQILCEFNYSERYNIRNWYNIKDYTLYKWSIDSNYPKDYSFTIYVPEENQPLTTIRHRLRKGVAELYETNTHVLLVKKHRLNYETYTLFIFLSKNNQIFPPKAGDNV